MPQIIRPANSPARSAKSTLSIQPIQICGGFPDFLYFSRSFARCCYSAARTLHSCKAATQYVHDAWNSNDGLPQDSVNAVAQTGDGYIWIATQEGLVRFDGVRFTVFD